MSLQTALRGCFKELKFTTMNKLIAYLKGSREELAKVDWPNRQVTTNHTIMVIGVSVLMAAFLGGIDFLLSKVLEVIVG
jgi:preprotein translocase subunit SecE